MKKLILAIAAILVASVAHAQIGVVAGVASSQTNLEDAAANYKSVSQYHAGLTARIPFGIIGIQPSFVWNAKGTSVESVANDGFQFDTKTYYLELPVQLQLRLLKLGTTLSAMAVAEPFVGYAIDIKHKLDGEDLSNIISWDDLDRLDYGVGLGGSAVFFDHVQASVIWRWRMGRIADAGSSLNEEFQHIKDLISTTKSNELRVSIAYLF